MIKKSVNTDDLISVIIKGIDDVKGDDIQLLDLRGIETVSYTHLTLPTILLV